MPPADFLLETELRGTPPKSEKAAAFWRVGGAGRGVQPFLRKESSEFEGEGSVDSASLDSGFWILDSTELQNRWLIKVGRGKGFYFWL